VGALLAARAVPPKVKMWKAREREAPPAPGNGTVGVELALDEGQEVAARTNAKGSASASRGEGPRPGVPGPG